MLLIGNNKDIIKELKYNLSSRFDMKDLSAINVFFYMDIKIDHVDSKIWLNQRTIVERILERFNIQEHNPVKAPIHIGANLSTK